MKITIEKAALVDLPDIVSIHNEFTNNAKGNEKTFIDKRTTKEIRKIVNEGFSLIVKIEDETCGYSLFSKYKDGLIGKGIILTKKALGLGLQRLIYTSVKREHKLYIVSSRHNEKSIKNIIECGLVPIEQINENDFLYGAC